MNFSMTGQEKCDLLIQVTAWAGLTVHIITMNIIIILRTTTIIMNILVLGYFLFVQNFD